LAEFDLGDTEEIMRWILSFGRHAEVAEPEELRGRVQEEIQALLTVYLCQESEPNTLHTQP
jgi:predicted DNA-binding transcriptional regulator YafY